MINIVLENKENKHIIVDQDTTIITKEFSDCVLIVDLNNDLDISIDLQIADNSKLVVFYNNMTNNLKVTESSFIGENSDLKIAYCELESQNLDRISNFDLVKEGATITIIGSSIVADNKHFEITCNHKASKTQSEIETYGIVLKGGQYYIKANGVIEKGAKGSKSHQTSRVLTFDNKQNATVLPMLCIDENDVEASHATSIGQLDENQLYYLMSRGLNEQEALRLMSLGYLLPLTNVTSDEQLKMYLTDLIERKVKETCLM